VFLVIEEYIHSRGVVVSQKGPGHNIAFAIASLSEVKEGFSFRGNEMRVVDTEINERCYL